MGSAFLYTVSRSGYKIGLPEVIEDEIVKQTKAAAFEAKEKIERNFRDIQAIIGSRSIYSLPSEQDVIKAITSRFNELDSLLLRIPFTIEHAKSALTRVNQGIPPSSTKQQQFKDCAIWEAALELAKTYDIKLVSSDGDFFKDKGRRELNIVLAGEVVAQGVVIDIYSSIESCLERLEKERPEIESDLLAEKIYACIKDEISRDVASENLRVAKLSDQKIRAFITQEHNRLAVEYILYFEAINNDVNELNKDLPAFITVEGECAFNLELQAVENNQINVIGKNWTSTDGVGKVEKGVFLRTAPTLARRAANVPYTARVELNDHKHSD